MAKYTGIDAVAHQRALRDSGATEVYTQKVIHIMVDNACLCGFGGTVYRVTGRNPATMPKCGRCQARLEKRLAERVKESVRNYWGNPLAGREVIKAPTIKAKGKPLRYDQPMLPDELLPTGTGRGMGLWQSAPPNDQT